MARRIPFYWNAMAMANSLPLESRPYLTGASYASNDENENRNWNSHTNCGVKRLKL